MQPDPSVIVQRLSITEPLVGFYDAPDPAPFAPLVVPGSRQCIFASLKKWREGKTLHVTREKHGCGGEHLFGESSMSRSDLVKFLCDEEGLRASPELMEHWLDSVPNYRSNHAHLLFGPLRADQYEFLRTVTFYVNPDQLAVLVVGAGYYSRPGDIEPVLARFGSGCMQLAGLFDDLDVPQAIIGATDQSIRRYLEPCTLALTVTRPMFELLCRWAADPKSSLHAEFTTALIEARGGSLATPAAGD
jgi:hypothetical protein